MVGLATLHEDVLVAEGRWWKLLVRRQGWNLCYIFKKYCSQNYRVLNEVKIQFGIQ